MAQFRLRHGRHVTGDRDARPRRTEDGVDHYPDKTFYPGDAFIAEGDEEATCLRDPDKFELLTPPSGEWSFDPTVGPGRQSGETPPYHTDYKGAPAPEDPHAEVPSP